MVKFVFVILGLTAFLAGFLIHSFFTTQQSTSVEWVGPHDIQRDRDAALAEIQKLGGIPDDRHEKLGMLRALACDSDAITAESSTRCNRALERAAAITVQKAIQQTVTQPTTRVATPTTVTTAATTTSSGTANKPKSKSTSTSDKTTKSTKEPSTATSSKVTTSSKAVSRVPMIQYTNSLKPTSPPCGFGELVKMDAGFSQCIYERRAGDLVSDALRGEHAWGDCEALRDKFVQTVPNAVDGVYLDADAHLGTCGFYIAQLGGKVFAFGRPVVDDAKLLQYSLTYNKFTTYNFLNAAAAHTTGTESAATELNTHLSSRPVTPIWPKGFPLIRIDDYVHEHVNLMRLVCEGCELPALQGAEKLIRNYGIDRIVFQYFPLGMQAKGIFPIALLQQVWNFGYDVYQEQDNILAPETWENFTAGRDEFMPTKEVWLDLDAVYSGPRSNPIPLAGNNGYMPSFASRVVPQG
eukprot:TRINITY_DN66067_c1_g1_i3.p1 TRINITY_DN66067_c1_g1~~TRINITY_DN66067_c1_g1_i3.p1  ORF type:complete len:466 (-),score=39.75 TRINITY_DN66067_c1_g1_i3:266-1663(-)